MTAHMFAERSLEAPQTNDVGLDQDQWNMDTDQLDLSQVELGSCVYVRMNGFDKEYGDAEGMQYVSAVDGDLLTGDTGDKFLRSHVVEHLAGVKVINNHCFNRRDDNVLIAMGAELVKIAPVAETMWEEVRQLRPALDAAVKEAQTADPLALPGHIWERITTTHPAGIAWSKAADTSGRSSFGNRTYMLTCTINRCRAHTPLGMYYRTYALHREVYNEGGVGGDPSEDTFLCNLLKSINEDAEVIMARIDPPKATGTLADLIEAHKASYQRFCDSIDAENEARDSLNALDGNEPITTPALIRNGSVQQAITVRGDDAEEDRAAIETAHEGWAQQFNLHQLKSVSPRAAKLIRAEIDASVAECLRRYDTETLPLLEARRAPFIPAILEWKDANDAEDEAFDELLRYRPTSLGEVAHMARYLQTTGNYDRFTTGENGEKLLATLSTLDGIA